MSGWAAFRKTWVKPEIYPLIGTMVAAVGVCTTTLITKGSESSLTWSKAKRAGGTAFAMEDVEEVVPMWSTKLKGNSTEIFGNSRYIKEINEIASEDASFTVVVGDEEEEEEEPEAEQEAEAASEPEPEIAAAAPALDVVDDAAETINAAVDAAIESASAAVAESTGTAASSVAETVEISAKTSEPDVADS